MTNNDLRTKVTDLPICTDIEQLDTILGIGKDNAMYRVDSENIGGGGKWEPLSITLGSYYTFEFNQNEIIDAIDRGGKIHILANKGNQLFDFDFIISSTYINPYVQEPSFSEGNTLNNLVSKYYIYDVNASSIYYSACSIAFGNSETHAELGSFQKSINNTENPLLIEDSDCFKIVGAFFEPIKNIGDLSKVTENSPR